MCKFPSVTSQSYPPFLRKSVLRLLHPPHRPYYSSPPVFAKRLLGAALGFRQPVLAPQGLRVPWEPGALYRLPDPPSREKRHISWTSTTSVSEKTTTAFHRPQWCSQAQLEENQIGAWKGSGTDLLAVLLTTGSSPSGLWQTQVGPFNTTRSVPPAFVPVARRAADSRIAG